LSKYARREVTGICFLTRSIFKETPKVGTRPNWPG
jgi:hypothetical protein